MTAAVVIGSIIVTEMIMTTHDDGSQNDKRHVGMLMGAQTHEVTAYTKQQRDNSVVGNG